MISETRKINSSNRLTTTQQHVKASKSSSLETSASSLATSAASASFGTGRHSAAIRTWRSSLSWPPCKSCSSFAAASESDFRSRTTRLSGGRHRATTAPPSGSGSTRTAVFGRPTVPWPWCGRTAALAACTARASLAGASRPATPRSRRPLDDGI